MSDVIYFAALLSPMVLDRPLLPDCEIDGLPGKLVSACIGKPLKMGGWNSTGNPRGPLPLKEVIPAGSVLFMKNDKKGKAINCHLAHIGKPNTRAWGFGQVVIGKY